MDSTHQSAEKLEAVLKASFPWLLDVTNHK